MIQKECFKKVSSLSNFVNLSWQQKKGEVMKWYFQRKNIKPRQPFFGLRRVSRHMEDFSTWLCTSSATGKKAASWDTNSVLGFFLVSNAANCALNLGQLHDGFMM